MGGDDGELRPWHYICVYRKPKSPGRKCGADAGRCAVAQHDAREPLTDFPSLRDVTVPFLPPAKVDEFVPYAQRGNLRIVREPSRAAVTLV